MELQLSLLDPSTAGMFYLPLPNCQALPQTFAMALQNCDLRNVCPTNRPLSAKFNGVPLENRRPLLNTVCLSAAENILDRTPRQERRTFICMSLFIILWCGRPTITALAAVLEGEIFFGSCYTAAVPRIKEHFL